MGGNIFKELGSRRMSSEECFEVGESVVEKLLARYPDSSAKIIPSYTEKAEHGDIDIILVKQPDMYLSNPVLFLMDIGIPLHKSRVSKNGDVISFLYQGFAQVDLIFAEPEEYDFSLKYFSYNDLGNLCGRIFHKAGFKFGHNGLFYVLRDEDNPTRVIDNILVSRDYNLSLHFMGYHALESKEFRTLEDVFEFAISSPYAYKDIYLLENRNHTSRTRDRKRKTYNDFLNYLRDVEFSEPMKLSKKTFLEKAKNYFPGFETRLLNALDTYLIRKKVKERFNGEIVRSLTGLDGKELGRFISEYKTGFLTEKRFEDFVISKDPITVANDIQSFYESREDYRHDVEDTVQ